MKLAISNIAWPVADEDAVARVLSEEGVTALELAPTTIWPNLLAIKPGEAAAYRRKWAERGVSIVAMQSLLFGKPELKLFESPERRREMLDYLRHVMRIGAELGAGPLVFGSPKNRQRGPMPAETAWPIAAEWFAELGAAAAAEGVTVVLEANPTDYAADFITHGADALRMVRAVNSPGLKLHLDTACMTLAGDALGLITSGVELLAHFHVSEPMLEPVGGDSSKVNHPAFAQTLRGSGYRGHVSIEMKSSPSPVDAVRRAIRFVRRSYG